MKLFSTGHGEDVATVLEAVVETRGVPQFARWMPGHFIVACNWYSSGQAIQNPEHSVR